MRVVRSVILTSVVGILAVPACASAQRGAAGADSLAEQQVYAAVVRHLLAEHADGVVAISAYIANDPVTGLASSYRGGHARESLDAIVAEAPERVVIGEEHDYSRGCRGAGDPPCRLVGVAAAVVLGRAAIAGDTAVVRVGVTRPSLTHAPDRAGCCIWYYGGIATLVRGTGGWSLAGFRVTVIS